jgi:DNA-binding transcriptional LysR family regulator
MDVDLARTFLEVLKTGSFISAAENLFITQTAVTARIRNLEDQLGCRLFTRNRQGAKLTENGERFVEYATRILSTWEAARRDLPLPEGTGNLVTIGAETSLWNPLFLECIKKIRASNPDLAIRAEVGDAQHLLNSLRNGSMEIALLHQPEYSFDLVVEQLLEEKLIQIQSVSTPAPYIYVDWGATFGKQHDAALPQLARTSLNLNLGPLAINYILQNGGRGYFRTRVVQKHIEEGTLEQVPDSPEFSYPIYLVFRRESTNPSQHTLLEIIRETSKEETDWF